MNTLIKKKSMQSVNLLLFVTAMFTSLIAGLFFAYACSVNPGLAKLDDSQYLSAMQSINRAILNPAFLVTFMGAALLLPLCVYAFWQVKAAGQAVALCIATVLYLAGVIGVTIGGNVPLNEALDIVDLRSLSDQKLSEYRTAFEKPWNKLHTIRTIVSIMAAAVVMGAVVAEDWINKLFTRL